MTKTELTGAITTRLDQVVENFCAFLENISTEAPPQPGWGPHPVLAHIVYHHEIYAAQIEALISGVPAPLPKGSFNELNAAAAAQYAAIPLPDLVARLRAVNRRLCALYSAHDIGECAIQVKKGSTAWKLNNLLPAVASHIYNHHQELEKSAVQTS